MTSHIDDDTFRRFGIERKGGTLMGKGKGEIVDGDELLTFIEKNKRAKQLIQHSQEIIKSTNKKLNRRIERIAPRTNTGIVTRPIKDLQKIEFNQDVFVRFEKKSDLDIWPSQSSIGNLPFNPELVSPARGNRLSVIRKIQLEKDGFYTMSRKQKEKYLSKYGIRYDKSRKIVEFQIEKNSPLENYQGFKKSYTNIIVENQVPAIKIISKD
jgi:hypothetical protein